MNWLFHFVFSAKVQSVIKGYSEQFLHMTPKGEQKTNETTFENAMD
jgi:hypothetical protein